jgi:hypothetical protein
MTNVSHRTESKSWHVITMPNPANRAEIYLALRWAEDAYEKAYGRKAEHDTAFEMDAGDDEIVIRIELPKEKN